MTLLIVAAAVIVVLLLLLRIADRHDRRRGHRPRRMGEISSATHAQRRNLQKARAARYLPGGPDDLRRARGAKKGLND